MTKIDKDTLERIRKIISRSFEFKETMNQTENCLSFDCKQEIEQYEKDVAELMNGKVFDFWNK